MPAPDKLPADFDFSKQGPPDKLPANFDFGGQPNQTAEQPGYWQELWQQSGIPGLIKGIKEHPAETVANAIGGLMRPLASPYSFGPMPGEATGPNPAVENQRENLTRSPQSAAAAGTLGALALAPTVAGPIGEGLANAGKYMGAATKAGAPGVIGGLARAGAGEVLAKLPGMELPARFGLQYPAIRQVAKAIEKGHEAGMGAVRPAEAAVPRPVRASKAPSATAPPAPPPEMAPSAAPGKTAADMLNEEMGTKEAALQATPVTAKAPGQALAESYGETWHKLSQDDKLSYAHMEAAEQSAAARNQPAPAYVPRTPADYGVKAAGTPPQAPQSAPAPVTAPAAPPSVPIPTQTSPSLPPNIQPIRPEPAPELPAPKPASGAANAKSARYADAISQWAHDMGMSPKAIADQWGTTTSEVRGQILLQLKQKGYLAASETIPKTSAQGIVDALKAKAETIKPPAGFSMGSMGAKPPAAAPSVVTAEPPAAPTAPEAASPAPNAIESTPEIQQNGGNIQATNLRQVMKGDVRQATAGEINKALDKVDQMDRQATEDFIKAGRGNERPSDYANKTDPLSMRQNDLYRQRMILRNEIERRYGPGAPNRLPKGFGPLRS